MKPATWTSSEKLGLAVVAALGFALRLHTLSAQPFWSDEYYTLKMVTQPSLLQDILFILVTDLYPPLYHLFVWTSTRLSHAPFFLRFWSLAGGVASVALVYVLARRIAGPRAALIAGLLAALSPMGVYYAHEAKIYSFYSALCLWTLYETLAVLEEPERGWKRLALAAAACFYTYYLTPYLLFPLILGAGLAWIAGRRRQALNAFKGLLAACLAALPLLPFFVKSVLIFRASFTVQRGFAPWYTAQNFSNGFMASPAATTTAAILFLGAIALNWRRRGSATAFGAGLAVAAALLPSLANHMVSLLLSPNNTDRALLGSAYAWALAAGLGLAVLPLRLSLAGLAMALTLNARSLAIHYDPATRTRYDFKAGYLALEKLWRAGEPVFHSDTQSLLPYAYYDELVGGGQHHWNVIPPQPFSSSPAAQGMRAQWRRAKAWLEARGLGVHGGIDPHYVLESELEKAIPPAATRLWVVVPSVPTLTRCWAPMLNLARHGFVAHDPFDPESQAWLKARGFRLAERGSLQPGTELYLYERPAQRRG